MKIKYLTILLIAAVVLAACSPSAPLLTESTTDTNLSGKATEISIPIKSTAQPEETGESVIPESMAETPAWFDVSLQDARTDESFTINDYQGKVVLVETLAMWCSNCLKQQKQVLELHNLLGERDDFISVGIDIDINENLPDLKAYIENNGFTWKYTVASQELAREISNLYGDQYLNPPSTPMLIIDRKGEAHMLPFGIKSAQELYAALEPFLTETIN